MNTRALNSSRICRHVCRARHYASSPKEICEWKGAYATTEICALFTNNLATPNEDVAEFLKALKQHSKKYYNLKKLVILAPYTIFDGGMLSTMLSIPSCLTEIDLSIFAFHTPKDTMWIPTGGMTLHKLELHFDDGIAFPWSGSDMLYGIEHNNDIQSIKLYNHSPHNPIVEVDRKLRAKIDSTYGIRIKYT